MARQLLVQSPLLPVRGCGRYHLRGHHTVSVVIRQAYLTQLVFSLGYRCGLPGMLRCVLQCRIAILLVGLCALFSPAVDERLIF